MQLRYQCVMTTTAKPSPRPQVATIMGELDVARRNSDWPQLIRCGGELERFGCFAEAWNALAEGAELKGGTLFPIWNGPRDKTGRLLVRRRIRHIGAELRNARFINQTLQDVEALTVAAEARLIPLLQRTFPAATFVDVAEISSLEGYDAEASYERLALHYGPDEKAILDGFIPLAPPPSASPGPEIGIAWFSSNSRKPLPALGDWAEVLAGIKAPIASLQYDEDAAGIEELSRMAGKPVRPSGPIDQMIDIDGFAGQVASVAGVVTISNTTAHMAGALGIPCVVILDDMQHLTWPEASERSPFYPSLRLIRQGSRPWPDVIAEAFETLHQYRDEKHAHQ